MASHYCSFKKALTDLLYDSKSSLLGALSSAFEWYDYALFGYFATIISKQFFPASNPLTALLSSFAVFATGFAMRPLGAIIFGYIGDRMGRRKALMLSLVMMAIPTTTLGLLPTYDSIGVWATVLLVCVRLFQGLAVGGNYGGSFIFTIEYAPMAHRALAGSLATFGTLGGLFLGSGVAFLFSQIFSESQLLQYGWRIPFLFGGLSAVLAHFIRHFVPEKADDAILREEGAKFPLKDIWEGWCWDVVKTIGIILLDGVGIYVVFVFMTTFASTFLHLNNSDALLINTLTMALLVICIPIFGFISDIVGARKVLKWAATGFMILGFPFYYWLVNAPSLVSLSCLQVVFAIVIGAVYGAIPLTVVTVFPRHIRYTACGMAFNISIAIFGGTAPFIVTGLIQQTGILLIPGIIISLVGLVSFICLQLLRHDYN